MKILLHICCAVCAGPAIERLMIEGHTVTGYFYNPNIHPQDEYGKRLGEAGKVAKEYGVELIEGPYDRENWFGSVKGYEYDPEGGKRCETCFRMRLERTYNEMKKRSFDKFTTTLSVGPMKNAELINRVGLEIDIDRFIPADFKKKDGFKRAMELSKELGLYHQNYCGCIYSKEEMLRRKGNN